MYNKVEDKITEISSTKTYSKTYLDDCNCLPSCTLIQYYDANLDRVKINLAAIKNFSRLKKDINERLVFHGSDNLFILISYRIRCKFQSPNRTGFPFISKNNNSRRRNEWESIHLSIF